MSLIKGENVMLYVYDGGFFKPFVCGLDCSLTTKAGSIGTSISGAGVWETNEYTSLSWEGSFNGLVYLQMANTLALPDIRSLQFNRRKVLCRFARTDSAAVPNYYQDEGYGLITSVSDSGANESMAAFSVELLGTGPLVQLFTPTIVNPSGKVKIIEYTATGPMSTYTNSLLIGKDVVNIFIDGPARSKILTSGTPLNQEAKFVASTGTITFAQPLTNLTELRVEYQDI